MDQRRGVTLEVLEERLRGVQEDVAELRQLHREDHHRLRTLEGSVSKMIDAQRDARESESRQYRRLGNRYALGQLVMAAAVVALTLVTILIHTT